MALVDDICTLTERAGPLVNVTEARFDGNPGFVTAYHLAFSNLKASIVADGEYDTVDVTMGSFLEDAESENVDVSDKPPWREVIGFELFGGWQLTNEHGYIDGVRLEFGTMESTTAFELIVEASQFSVYRLQRHTEE